MFNILDDSYVEDLFFRRLRIRLLRSAAAGSQRITTPGSLIVPAGAREMEIRVELDGYEPATVLLTRPGSSAFAGCLQRAASDPQRGSNEGALQGPVSGLMAIAIAASRAAAECSMEADVLVPTFVFVKLVTSSVDLAPLPLGRSIGGW
jgi:hypothetical protein